LIYKEECYRVIGLCMKVRNKLGKGFHEIVYKDALEKEFIKEGIPFVREKSLKVIYDSEILKRRFNADFLLFDSIILEVKARWNLEPGHYKQTLNYLKASKHKLALLVNFGEEYLRYKRIISTH